MTFSTHASPIRTLFVHSSNEMYGADRILLEILRSLPSPEREAAVVYLPDDLPNNDGRLARHIEQLAVETIVGPLPVLRRRYLRPRGLVPLLSRIWRSYRIMRRIRPDVVYGTTTAMVLCLPLACLAGVRSRVLHVQEIWSKRESLILGIFASFATQILCISAASIRSLGATLAKRATLLVNAHQDSGKDLVPTSYSGPVRFIVASRWNAWKGHVTLLDAWDTDEPPGQLLILGGPPPIGSSVDVPELVGKLKNPDSVRIIGEVQDIEGYLDDADFLVLPSDNPEPFGLVVLEAFARGRAVIASRAGGVADIVEDGQTGLLYEIGNAEDLRSKLAVACKESAQELGKNARRAYLETYSIDSYRRRFGEVWSKITSGERTALDAHR